MAWFSIPKTLVEGTKARAADVQENFDGVKAALLYLLSEEEHSIFPQLSEAAKRILTMTANVTLYGEGGVSQFLQLPSTAKRKVLWGRINPTGGVNGGSGGFSVVHEATGVFVVNVAPGFSIEGTPVVCDAGESGQHYLRVTATSTSSFRVAIFDGGFNLADSGFNFIAIG